MTGTADRPQLNRVEGAIAEITHRNFDALPASAGQAVEHFIAHTLVLPFRQILPRQTHPHAEAGRARPQPQHQRRELIGVQHRPTEVAANRPIAGRHRHGITLTRAATGCARVIPVTGFAARTDRRRETQMLAVEHQRVRPRPQIRLHAALSRGRPAAIIESSHGAAQALL